VRDSSRLAGNEAGYGRSSIRAPRTCRTPKWHNNCFPTPSVYSPHVRPKVCPSFFSPPTIPSSTPSCPPSPRQHPYHPSHFIQTGKFDSERRSAVICLLFKSLPQSSLHQHVTFLTTPVCLLACSVLSECIFQLNSLYFTNK
jgi:hypothetical protein